MGLRKVVIDMESTDSSIATLTGNSMKHLGLQRGDAIIFKANRGNTCACIVLKDRDVCEDDGDIAINEVSIVDFAVHKTKNIYFLVPKP
jgi:hypothetical protein